MSSQEKQPVLRPYLNDWFLVVGNLSCKLSTLKGTPVKKPPFHPFQRAQEIH